MRARSLPSPALPLHAGLSASLRTLLLDGNQLASVGALGTLARLEHLSVSRNRLPGLGGLEPLAALRRLAAAGNRIGGLEAVAPVAAARLLGELDLRGNPLEQARGRTGLGWCREGHPAALVPWCAAASRPAATKQAGGWRM
jgi:hypothetical protein